MSERERLINIASKYNIGLTTVAELLQKHGCPLYDVTPNTYLTKQQLAIIHATYGKLKRYRIYSYTTDDFSSNPKVNRRIINAHGWNRIKGDVFVRCKNRYVFIPVNQGVDHLDYWNVEDVEAKSPDAINNFKIIKEKLCARSGTIPVIPEMKDVNEEQLRSKSSNVFKPRQPHFFSTKNAAVTIESSRHNVLTRPQRNIQEERRSKQDFINKESKFDKHDAIREVWQKFVDIQEQLIRQRSSPIRIDVDSIEIDNDKLFVTIDESPKEQQLQSIFLEQLGAESFDLAEGSVLVDEEKWYALSEGDLSEILKVLSENYIELDTTPSINAVIEYGQGLGQSDQMTMEELKQLEAIINEGKLLEGSIDDSAVFISKVNVLKEDLLKYLFGSHYVRYEQKQEDQESTKIVEQIVYHNQYISWENCQKYQDIGLTCKQYTIVFKIHNQNAQEELKECFDCWFPNTETFEFKRVFNKKSPFHQDFLGEINDYIQQFIEEASLYCTLDDVEINVDFAYYISKVKLVTKKFQEIASVIAGNEGYGFNAQTGAIGIDFNWRKDDIQALVHEIEEKVQFVSINMFENHRFKCNVKTQIIGFDEFKQSLEKTYENISVSNDAVNHKIHIRLPYVDKASYGHLASRLQRDLQQITIAGLEVRMSPKIEGKIRLNVKYNNASRLEDVADSIANMKKADFGFMLDDMEFAFGKLLKANYPDLVFDIDVDDSQKENVIEAFESKAINTLIPILTGDLEKISRLKDTFTKATTGTELINPRLQRFIFDSSCATKTEDIQHHLCKTSPVYRELSEHLLNPYINESQKAAIIKAILAVDLAVIQGPPGTGKSTAIAELIWQLVRKGFKQGNKRERILLTSETNLAVDNAISRIVNSRTNLVKPIRFGEEEKLSSEGLQFSIDLMKRWVEEGDDCLIAEESNDEFVNKQHNDLILKNWLTNITNRSFNGSDDKDSPVVERWHNFLQARDKGLREVVYANYINHVNVIGATCSSIGDKRAGTAEFNGFTQFYHNYCEVFKQSRGRSKIEFSTVIQDESSKATPAELVLPFVYGKKAIVIGDHRQLPPMLDKEDFDNTLDYALQIAHNDADKEGVRRLKAFVNNHFDEMEISHFQKLYENIDPSLKGTFNLQYRMHPAINEVVEQFYTEDGGLRCGLITPKDLGVEDRDFSNPASRYHGLDIKGLIGHNTHVLFIDSKSPEMMDGTSRVNYGEVETIDKLLSRFEESSTFQRYLSKFTKEEDRQIGIISFYGKQIKQLRSMAFGHPTLPIRVSTVDRFQGMERNIVIVSMVRSNTIQSSRNQMPDWKRYPELGYPAQTSLGFAQSPNRLNVALSRAKRLLIIVGNRDLFSTLDIYQRLFVTISANKNNMILQQNEV